MTELESLKRTRSGLRARLSFMDRSIQELLQDSGKQFEVCAALTQMEAYWAKLQEVQGAIESYVEDEGALEKEVENAMAFETTVVDLRAKVQRYLHGSPKTTATPEVSAAGPNLPKWNLPKFSGDVLEFNSFWDQFEAGVHGRNDLSNVAKLVYLKSALCGEALEAVDGFHVTNANYPVVVETLRERFGRESLVVESHILSLLKLTKEEEAHGSSTLRELFDKMNRHVRALEAIGKSVENKLTAEDILLVLFKQLLPPAVRKRWEQKTLTSADSENVTLKTLFDFLRTEVDIEECTKHPALVSKTRTQRTQKNSNMKRNDGQYSAVALQASTNRNGSCLVCSGTHTVHTCPTFLSMSPTRRLQVSRKNRLCFVCLELGHLAAACKSQDRCSIKDCRKSHHTLLHGEADCSRAQVGLLRNHRMEKVFLQTARARISGGNGSSLVITCLFDAGAQRSFIRKALADDLGLRGTTERVAIHTFGSHVCRMEKTRRVRFSLQPLDRRGTRQWMEALCLPHLCQPLEANPPISSSWSHLQDLTLADQFPRGKTIVDVLIGLDYYHAFMSGFTKNGSPKEPVAVQSSFGWILSGPAGSQEKGVQNVFQVTLSDSADELLKRIWSLDAIGLRDEEVEKPSQVMKRFQDSVSFDGQRYTVRLPWKSEGRLPDNYRLALRRLELLENRLTKDARLARLYADGMRSYVDNGFVERVEQYAATSGRHWYLPHHPVIKNESSTTKCRIVFDGSALYQGVSLNQFLEIGPPLQRDLVGILLRFRRFRYGIHGDIEKMFLQIALHEDDRDAVRFLWREKGAGTEPTVFRFTRLCFGLSCSPFLAIVVTQLHAQRNSEKYKQGASEVLKNMYVDDLVMSCSSKEEAARASSETAELLLRGGFKLTKCVSNMKEFNSWIHNSAPTGRETVKTLGLQWYTSTDQLALNHVSWKLESVATKRIVLKTLSEVFDPLGLIAPFLVEAKMLLQLMWKMGKDWDEPLTQPLFGRWNQWRMQLPLIATIRTDRWMGPRSSTEEVELHVFCDASSTAYGAAIYLKASNGAVEPHLVTAKALVAPVKSVTLPRLELLATLVGARLLTYVKEQLGLPIRRITCWSDSMVALFWIKGDSSKWKPFIRNRVQEIQQLTDPLWWHHCPTKDNSADLLSRGSRLDHLKESQLWWHGPAWLGKPDDFWPRATNVATPTAADEEIAETIYVCTVEPEYCLSEDSYENFDTLLRVTAWCLRFLSNARRSVSERNFGPLQVEELRRAEKIWVYKAQKHEFQMEISCLRKKQSIPQTSRLKTLDPFLDQDDLLRVGGRIQMSSLPYETCHPLILSKKSKIVEPLIRQCHQRNLHCGVEHTLSILRRKFWIMGGRSRVRKMTDETRLMDHRPSGGRMFRLKLELMMSRESICTCTLYRIVLEIL